jgi:hypothetical protein
MNRQQRRQRARSDVCIYCQLADGTMGLDDFERHCRGVRRDHGAHMLDEIAVEIRQHKGIPRAITAEAQVILASLRAP